MKTEKLYFETYGESPASVEEISGSGSMRHYYRIEGPTGRKCIGCEGNDISENQAFLYLTEHFLSKGLPVARVLAVADDCSCYLLEDLGDLSLFTAINVGRSTGIFTPDEVELLSKSIRGLADFQFKGGDGLDYNRCYPEKEMNRRMVMWDLNYFKYCFLKMSGTEFNESLLQDEFEKMADDLLAAGDVRSTFMYRDFQSRNIMINEDGTPYYIDYQGGRRGPIHYDVASFLWQAKAKLPQTLRMQLVDEYLKAASKYAKIDRDEFLLTLKQFVLFRTLQVLGAYGYRGLMQKKAHFVESIPYAMVNLRGLLEDKSLADAYPYLFGVLKELASAPRFAPRKATPGLKVKVMSFSYKKGIPDDYSGNGGGYVFDCRGIHNPGRYEPYKQLTGLDQEVIDFLEEDGGVNVYLEHVYALVDSSVEVYMRRGFTSLMISFGCTGGRHRSVYCAEHTAHHIKEKYGVTVELTHRERGIEQIL